MIQIISEVLKIISDLDFFYKNYFSKLYLEKFPISFENQSLFYTFNLLFCFFLNIKIIVSYLSFSIKIKFA